MTTVEIRTPTGSDELIRALRLSACIVLAAALWVSNSERSTSDASRLFAWQVEFAALPSRDQAVYRSASEGLLEAENRRSGRNVWPDVAELVADGIPPFAPDAISARDGFTWTRHADGFAVQYLGRPTAPGVSAFLVSLIEPDPAAPPDPAPPDAIHHVLRDGTKIHASIWRHTKGAAVPEKLSPIPETEGWSQVVVDAEAGPEVP